MAEEKKSALLYCDLIHTIEGLKDSEAGRVFKHYLRYINDMNPKAPDRLTEIVFEPIKQSLKRDLKKWENKKKKNSDNAKKRWAKEMPNDATASDRIKSDANHAVSDKVSVSDSVSDKVKDIRLSPKEKKISEPDFNFDFIDDRFSSCFFDWIKFRKEISEPILYQAVLENSYKDLISLSKNDSELAEKIVKQSMDKGWKHLYQLKTDKKENNGESRLNAITNF